MLGIITEGNVGFHNLKGRNFQSKRHEFWILASILYNADALDIHFLCKVITF